MNAFHDLLKLKFLAAQSLQETLLFAVQRTNPAVLINSLQHLRQRQEYGTKEMPDIRKMQTLLVGGNHWVIVTNQHPGPVNLVIVYDTLGYNPDENFGHLVSAVFRPTSPSLDVCWPVMITQKGSSICGVHCAANLTCLCMGRRPDQCTFVHEVC